MIDRDMVNCLHYLYQGRQIGDDVFGVWPPRKSSTFWCPEDTFKPLSDANILNSRESKAWELGPAMSSFIKEVETQLASLPKSSYAFGYPFSGQPRQADDKRPAFLAIPYADKFQPVQDAVLAAADAAGFVCEVTGNLSSPGNIVDQVWQGIRKADVVVADITGNNPNVMYEVGLAQALGKDVILISQSKKAPFDIRGARLTDYALTDLEALTASLTAAFKAVEPRYPYEDSKLSA